MGRMKKIVLVLLAVILILPSFLTTASTNDSNAKENKTESESVGKIGSKDEVIYANLSATGERQEIYVVNTLEIDEPGKVTDYGTYSSLKNLTNLTEMTYENDQVMFTADKGKFYYQGNMVDQALPWDISIDYLLDGEKIAPSELAGKDGQVQIRMNTSANETINSVFFENYLLQVSLTLNSDLFTNIRAEEGTIANAGKNKQVTFTVMPEKEEELVLEADVVGFELDGIEISGVPSSMPIEKPDVNEMTDDMRTLSDAISDLNDGVEDFKEGVSELNSGVVELQDGSKQYKDGIVELDDGSSNLVDGSKEIEEALNTMSNSLDGLEELDFSSMEDLANGLTLTVDGLREISQGLENLKENYVIAYGALDGAIEDMPLYNITQEDFDELYESGANQEVIAQLEETYHKSVAVKLTYGEVKAAFDAVEGSLEGVIKAINDMANNMDEMASGVSASLKDMESLNDLTLLQEGIAELAKNYQSFHDGLVQYTGGVGELSDSYKELHSGIVDLSDGTNELEDGAVELHEGTTELHEETSNLPDQMTEEIDEMMSDYDKSDFEAVSFISAKNEQINTVQFVFKTESIQYEEPEVVEVVEEEEKGFWAKLKDLFS
ncbi:YhgE/Pip domain-containing protein [Ornithinibacillus halophilus]